MRISQHPLELALAKDIMIAHYLVDAVVLGYLRVQRVRNVIVFRAAAAVLPLMTRAVLEQVGIALASAVAAVTLAAPIVVQERRKEQLRRCR